MASPVPSHIVIVSGTISTPINIAPEFLPSHCILHAVSRTHHPCPQKPRNNRQNCEWDRNSPIYPKTIRHDGARGIYVPLKQWHRKKRRDESSGQEHNCDCRKRLHGGGIFFTGRGKSTRIFSYCDADAGFFLSY